MNEPFRLPLALAALAALLAASACSGSPGVTAGPAGTGIGRVCAPDAPRELRAAQAIAAAYRLSAVRDLQLLETDQPGMLMAVYRLGPGDARPQELFAATVLDDEACDAVIAQGEACDPLAFSPIYLPPFSDDAVRVEPATFGPWDAVDEPVVAASIVAGAQNPEPGFPTAQARGRCIFRLASLPDGRLAPATLFAWAESASTDEVGRDAKRYLTDATTEVRASAGPAPRALASESLVVDVACGDVDDRQAACAESCLAERPHDGAGDVPDAAAECAAACADVEAAPGEWCDAVVDRVTEWLDGRVEPDGRIRYETTGQEEARSLLDADCLLGRGADGSSAADMGGGTGFVARIEACRVPASGSQPASTTEVVPSVPPSGGSLPSPSGLPQEAPGSGSSGSR